MKKSILFTLLLACIGGGLYWANLSLNQTADKGVAQTAENPAEEKTDYTQIKGIKKALLYRAKIRANQETGTVDPKDMRKARDLALATNVEKDQEYDWQFIGPNNVGGRCRALLVDQDNPDRLIAASVSGGIFTSDNGGEDWVDHPDNQNLPDLGVTSITQTDNGNIFLGTGEQIYLGYWEYSTWSSGASVFPGSGMYISTDGGTSFSLLPSTEPSVQGGSASGDPTSEDWAFIMVLESYGNTIYAGTNRGLKISTDAGETWTEPEGIPAAATVYDIAIASNGTVHVLASNRYYRSTDGTTFEDLSGNDGVKFPLATGNKVIAVSPEDPNYLYAITITSSSSCLNQALRSTDGGNVWYEIGAGGSDLLAIFGRYEGGVCDGQGFYDTALEVMPTDKNRFFVGGLTFWQWSETGGWEQLDNINTSSTNDNYLHADKHDIIFDHSNPDRMFVVSDGGVSRSDNASDLSPTFTTKNKNFNATQLYSIGADIQGRMIGGAQDNGTQFLGFDFNSAATSVEVNGGDGAYCELSKLVPGAVFAASQSGAMVRSSNGGESFGPYFDQRADCQPVAPGGGCTGDSQLDGAPEFITPYLLWEDIESYNNSLLVPGGEPVKNAMIVVGSGDGRVWLTPEPLNFSTIPRWFNPGQIQGSATVTGVAMSDDGDVIYASSSNGRVMRIRDLEDIDFNDYYVNPVTEQIFPADQVQDDLDIDQYMVDNGRYITAVNIGSSKNDVVVSMGNYGNDDYIYISENGGADWVSAQGDLPPMPVLDVIFDRNNGDRLLAATEMGVWMGDLVDGSYTWTPQNEGIGNVPVHRIRQELMHAQATDGNLHPFCNGVAPCLVPALNSSCYATYIGTHGRGIYRSVSTSTGFECDFDLLVFDDAVYPVGVEDLTSNSAINVYPNPIAANATVQYEIPESGQVSFVLYDMTGRIVQRISLGDTLAGEHTYTFNRGDLAAGNYVASIRLGKKNRMTKKIVLQ